MHFFNKVPNFDFMRWRGVNATLSLILVTASIVSFIVQGFNPGLDFSGGVQIEAGFTKEVDIGQVRDVIRDAGFAEAVIQVIDTPKNVSIRLPWEKHAKEEGGDDSKAVKSVSDKVIAALKEKIDPNTVRRGESSVSAKMGEELRDDGGIALLIVFFGIFIYVFLRFEWRSSLAAIIATIHDVVITAAFFSWFQWTFDLTVLAALLAVIGYSLNDTVVVYDRVRENFRKMRTGTPKQIMNASMNQTLSRTIMTSFVTLLSLIAIYFVGGEALQPFALALIIGIVVGTYSSIYVASSAALALGLERVHLLPQVKENAEKDTAP